MRGPEGVFEVVVVLGLGRGVGDGESQRGTCGHHPSFRFEQPREPFDTVGFLPGGGQCRLARPSSVEVGLYSMQVQSESRRTSVQDAAQGRSMGLPKRRQSEQVAKCIPSHPCEGIPCTSCARCSRTSKALWVPSTKSQGRCPVRPWPNSR